MDNNSKFKKFVGHPVTVEFLRFAGYTAATLGGRWLLGKAASAYRNKKAAAQLHPSQQAQPTAPRPPAQPSAS